MVAERVRLVVGERISERICEQIADVHVPQVVEQVLGKCPRLQAETETLHGTVEHILDVLVPDMVEQLVKLPKTVSENRTQELTVEHIVVDIPVLQVAEELVKVSKVLLQDRIQQRTIVDARVPQAVEELAEVFRVSSQDRIQQCIVEQTIPVIPLAEKIVELPVIQTEGTTQRGVNTHVQHVVNAVEVEKSEIIKQIVQRKKPIIQEKINQVTKHVEVPLSQFTDKVVDKPVVTQRQISMDQTVQKITEIPQLQFADHVNDVPVVLVAQVPRVLVVEKTTEIPQIWAAELLKFNTSKPGDEQISFKEYVNCMKERQNVISHITDESIAAVSSSSFRENLRRKGYEVFHMADHVDEFAVQQPKECDGTKPKSTMEEDLEADIAKRTGAAASIRQPHKSQEQGRRVEREKEKQGEEEKGVGEKRKKEERESDGKEERRGTEGERVARKEGKENEVEKDVTGWTEVTRNKRKKMVQIFVKVDEMKTVAMEVSPEDKVQKILNIMSKSDRDVYVTSGGRILKGSDKLKSCEVRDGSTVEVKSRTRGGGKHKDKKGKEEKKKQVAQLDDGMCAMACEQMRQVMETLKTLADNSTGEDKRRVVENVEELRKAIIGLRKQARGEELQRVAETGGGNATVEC